MYIDNFGIRFRFYPDFTGLENIHLGCAMPGLNVEQIAAKVNDIIDFSELADCVHISPLKPINSVLGEHVMGLFIDVPYVGDKNSYISLPFLGSEARFPPWTSENYQAI